MAAATVAQFRPQTVAGHHPGHYASHFAAPGSLLSKRQGPQQPAAPQYPVGTQGTRQVFQHHGVVSSEGDQTRPLGPDDKILSERVVEHEIRIPKRIVREEVIEKVLVVPETIVREEIVEEIQTVTETIIEFARPIYQEKLVEVPEVEYRDKIVEVVQKVVQDKVTEVPKIEYQERIVEVPKYVTSEKLVEVPDIEYREVIVEKIVEVPEIREQIVIREVAVPQYVQKVTEDQEAKIVTIERNIPLPYEAVTTYEYQLSQYQPRVNKVQYPLYVPRFIEVPVSAELFDAAQLAEMQTSVGKLGTLTTQQALGLQEIEGLATEFRQQQFLNQQVPADAFQVALTQAWKSGQLQMTTPQQVATEQYRQTA